MSKFHFIHSILYCVLLFFFATDLFGPVHVGPPVPLTPQRPGQWRAQSYTIVSLNVLSSAFTRAWLLTVCSAQVLPSNRQVCLLVSPKPDAHCTIFDKIRRAFFHCRAKSVFEQLVWHNQNNFSKFFHALVNIEVLLPQWKHPKYTFHFICLHFINMSVDFDYSTYIFPGNTHTVIYKFFKHNFSKSIIQNNFTLINANY